MVLQESGRRGEGKRRDSLDAHSSPNEQPDLRRRDIVVDELFHDDDVLPARRKSKVGVSRQRKDSREGKRERKDATNR